jgi:hypothetical protein
LADSATVRVLAEGSALPRGCDAAPLVLVLQEVMNLLHEIVRIVVGDDLSAGFEEVGEVRC